MLPGLVILLLFMAYPFFLGIWLSLTDKLVGFADYDYVGLENYRCCYEIRSSADRQQHLHLRLRHRAVQAAARAWPGAAAE